MEIYDPTCGSGSLLLKAADEAPLGITLLDRPNARAESATTRWTDALFDTAVTTARTSLTDQIGLNSSR